MRATTDARRKKTQSHGHSGQQHTIAHQGSSTSARVSGSGDQNPAESAEARDQTDAHDDLFDFAITDELRELAQGFENLGDRIREGFIPTSLIADLVLPLADHEANSGAGESTNPEAEAPNGAD